MRERVLGGVFLGEVLVTGYLYEWEMAMSCMVCAFVCFWSKGIEEVVSWRRKLLVVVKLIVLTLVSLCCCLLHTQALRALGGYKQLPLWTTPGGQDIRQYEWFQQYITNLLGLLLTCIAAPLSLFSLAQGLCLYYGRSAPSGSAIDLENAAVHAIDVQSVRLEQQPITKTLSSALSQPSAVTLARKPHCSRLPSSASAYFRSSAAGDIHRQTSYAAPIIHHYPTDLDTVASQKLATQKLATQKLGTQKLGTQKLASAAASAEGPLATSAEGPLATPQFADRQNAHLPHTHSNHFVGRALTFRGDDSSSDPGAYEGGVFSATAKPRYFSDAYRFADARHILSSTQLLPRFFKTCHRRKQNPVVTPPDYSRGNSAVIYAGMDKASRHGATSSEASSSVPSCVGEVEFQLDNLDQ